MSEHFRTPEQLSIIGSVQDKLQKHLRESSHRVSFEQLSLLIDSVSLTDLSRDPLTDQLGRTPLAKVRGREVTFDHRFTELTEAQQLHVLTHEYSHGLVDFFGSREDTQRLTELAKRVAQLPPEQISYYVGYLSEVLEQTESAARFLQEERLAELFSQYLESDRSFGGFIQAKLLEFPGQEEGLSEELRGQYQAIQEEIGSLDEYLAFAEDEEERATFLAHHPMLAEQYAIWQEIEQLFAEFDQEEFQEYIEGPVDDYDIDYWEDYALADTFQAESLAPTPEPTIFRPPAQQSNRGAKEVGGFFTFWNLFSTDNDQG